MYVTRYKEGRIRDSLSLAIRLFLKMLVSILLLWSSTEKPKDFGLSDRTLRRDELKSSDAGKKKDTTKKFALTGSTYDGARRSQPIPMDKAVSSLVVIGQGVVPWAVASKYHCPQPELLCYF